MGFEHGPQTMISPEEVKKITNEINETKSHLLSFVSSPDVENTKFSKLPVDKKLDIEMRIDKIINICDSEDIESEFGKRLNEVSSAYKSIKESMNDALLGMTVGQIKNQLRILSQPEGADAKLKEFISSMK